MLRRCYLWYMETLFACLKTSGFRFEDSHFTDPDRDNKMVALLAIALVEPIKPVSGFTTPHPGKKPAASIQVPLPLWLRPPAPCHP